MNRPIELALTSLIPAQPTPLPPQLISLTTSLLAQSRSKASNLQQKEEIARTYVCANIACERLKTRLDLPRIEPHPPCPPKIYRKVYGIIETALGQQQRTPSKPTPSKNVDGRDGSGVTSAKRRASGELEATPSKKRAMTTAAAATSGDRDKSCWDAEKELDAVRGLVRSLCRALEVPDAVPHVFAGAQSVMRLKVEERSSAADRTRDRRNGAATVEGQRLQAKDMAALVVVVLFYTWIRLLGAEVDDAKYSWLRSTAVSTVLKSHYGKDIAEQGLIERIEEFMLEASQVWLDMEWYHNIGVPTEDGAVDGDASEGEDEDEEEEREFEDAPSVLQSGLGTMMQPALEFLSAKRRRGYARWEKGIWRRIEAMGG